MAAEEPTLKDGLAAIMQQQKMNDARSAIMENKLSFLMQKLNDQEEATISPVGALI